jgi:hypothetical protein
MKEKQVAAIVRRVAMENGKLQLGALMPRIIADEDVSILFYFKMTELSVFLQHCKCALIQKLKACCSKKNQFISETGIH